MIQQLSRGTKFLKIVRYNHMDKTGHFIRSPQISKGIVKQVTDISPTIKLLNIYIENQKFDFKPGQWVDFHIPGINVVGGYSICSSPQLLKSDSSLNLAVKYSTHAPAHWVHKKCKCGDEVSLAVGGELFYSRNHHNFSDNLLLIAGGVGINPLFSIFNDIYLNNSVYNEVKNKTFILYSAVNDHELIFRDELDKIAFKSNSMKVSYFITKPVANIEMVKQKENIIYRRINESDIRAALDKMFCNSSDVISYLCGPEVMMDSMKSILKNCGLRNENIRYESWS
ncbi:oxidoreductase NAD-binding domain-containing protein 1 isoform X3 [Hydra vulgaris]|uniref:Oxidoreductase NAD-binding domain-containing protein 1 n=1 Tax=Hydra vulgaris TaxID=6087 RepID=A0ABM4CVD6_HYDVU